MNPVLWFLIPALLTGAVIGLAIGGFCYRTGADDALKATTKGLKQEALRRFAKHGPHDARGAALWDAGTAIRETWREHLIQGRTP